MELKTIKLEHKDFIAGFFPRSQPIKESRTLDWEKLREFIETFAAEDQIVSINAGLAEDWTYTNDLVWANGKYIDPIDVSSFFGQSVWATPSILVEYSDGSKKAYECWKYGEGKDVPSDWKRAE